MLVFARYVKREIEIQLVRICEKSWASKGCFKRWNSESCIKVDGATAHIGVPGTEVELKVVTHIPNQTRTCTGVLEIINRSVTAAKAVAVETICLACANRNTSSHVVTHRTTHDRTSLKCIVIPNANSNLCLGFIAGLFGGYKNGTRYRITAVKRALGPFQYLNLLHIEQFFVEAIGVCAQYTIDHIGKR